MATHVIAIDFPSPDGPQLLMQTTNALSSMTPRAETVLSVSHFQRAVLTLQGKDAQRGLFQWTRTAPKVDGRKVGRRKQIRHILSHANPFGTRWFLQLGELQGAAAPVIASDASGKGTKANAQIWACGSWSPGIPLLEGCVRSARLVCEEILRQEDI